MLCILLILALAFHAGWAVTVTLGPQDMAQEIGHNVTMACIVTNKADSESVQWKHKANGSDTFNAVTFNENVLGTASKYAVVSTYNLTVISLVTSDEGTYRCTAGAIDHDAFLTIVDLPNTLTMAWSTTPVNGNTVNLTCTATNGRPTPTIRWLLNGVDLTTTAIQQTQGVTANGYGTSISNLPLVINSGLNGQRVYCYAAYTGWDNAMNATLVIQTSGGRGITMSGILVTAIIALWVTVQ